MVLAFLYLRSYVLCLAWYALLSSRAILRVEISRNFRKVGNKNEGLTQRAMAKVKTRDNGEMRGGKNHSAGEHSG